MAKGAAIPLIAGGAALLLLSKGKKKTSTTRKTWGVRVNSDCSSVEIVDKERFYAFLNTGFRELADADPNLTFIQISDALFYEVAPHCTGFPGQPESGPVADLYAHITTVVGRLMIADARFKMPSLGALMGEAEDVSLTDWYRKWHNYPSSSLPTTPPSEVAFSSDLSRFKIGPDWYDKTVVPFVTEAAAEGRLDTVLTDFMERGVAHGRLVTAISELPKTSPAVKTFLAEVEDAIQEAKGSL
jgi:hypothetical protein